MLSILRNRFAHRVGCPVRLFATDAVATVDASRFEIDVALALDTIYEVAEAKLPDSMNSLQEGVLKIELTHKDRDFTFILNKHFLTKQIWYSSPVIGPAYFDAQTTQGKRWWSFKLNRDVFDQLQSDIKTATNGDEDLDFHAT